MILLKIFFSFAGKVVLVTSCSGSDFTQKKQELKKKKQTTNIKTAKKKQQDGVFHNIDAGIPLFRSGPPDRLEQVFRAMTDEILAGNKLFSFRPDPTENVVDVDQKPEKEVNVENEKKVDAVEKILGSQFAVAFTHPERKGLVTGHRYGNL